MTTYKNFNYIYPQIVITQLALEFFYSLAVMYLILKIAKKRFVDKKDLEKAQAERENSNLDF